MSFVAVLALVSFVSGRSDARKPPPKATRTAPVLPPHIARMAREARYAQVKQSAEPLGSADDGTEDEEQTPVQKKRTPQSKRPKKDRHMQRPNAGKQPTPASSAENSDIEADRRDSLERETSNDRRDDSASDNDSVLGEARAMAARVQQANVHGKAPEKDKATERVKIEKQIAILNARMRELSAEINDRVGPSAADADHALAELSRSSAASGGAQQAHKLWTCD